MERLGAAGESLGPAPTESPRAGPGRVRLRQPDRPAARRRRPPRRLRRRAGPPAGGRRPRGGARVLRQRRRRPDASASPPRSPARMTGGEMPEDGYEGEYVDRAGRAAARRGDRPGRRRRDRAPRRRAGPRGGAGDPGPLRRPLRQLVLRARPLRAAARSTPRSPSSSSAGTPTGATARSGCARTEFGDDKDRVLIRADGEPTYLAADVAYHWDKLERGFGRLIDVLGADHHGYAPRLRAAIAALGADPEALEALIMRLVHIVEAGERAQMSKRSGDFVSLDELIDDIGVDAARWFMLWRSHDTTGRPRPRARPPRVKRQPGLLRAVRARADRQHPAQGGRGRGGRGGGADARDAAGAHREAPGQAPARIPRRGARGGRAARAAPDLRLLDRRRRRLPRLLPRLPGGRRRGRGGRAVAPRPLPGSPSGRSPARSVCSASPPPSGCEGAGGDPGRAPRRPARRDAAPPRPRGLRWPAGRAGRGARGAGAGHAGGRRAGAIGLAAAAAAAGTRTALLECDLADPALADALGLADCAGPARVPALGGDARRSSSRSPSPGPARPARPSRSSASSPAGPAADGPRLARLGALPPGAGGTVRRLRAARARRRRSA